MTFAGTCSSFLAKVTGDAGGGVWLPPKASTFAGQIDWVFWFIFWICVFFFVLIIGLMILFVIKWRRREGVEAAVTATHHTPLELSWTIIPLILVIAIFYIGLDGYVDLIQPPKDAYEVTVIAKQWSWNFQHRNGASSDTILWVPAGRPVKLIMMSDDVLHALFIPAFRVKQDIVPGRFTQLWFEAKEPGTHQIFCAEYCGTSHSQMVAYVEVLAPAAFEKKLKEEADWPDRVSESNQVFAGARLYSRCKSCHSYDGSRVVGPSFKETHENWDKERALEGGGTVTIDHNYILNSILDPQSQIVEGFPNQMTSFAGQLTTQQIGFLIAFIRDLPKAIDKDGKLIIWSDEMEAQAEVN